MHVKHALQKGEMDTTEAFQMWYEENEENKMGCYSEK